MQIGAATKRMLFFKAYFYLVLRNFNKFYTDMYYITFIKFVT